MEVWLYVYDLSNGMARQFSPMFGLSIDAVYHTGIVVYGKEWYFGGGILSDSVGHTPYGVPLQRHLLGSTSIPQEVFLEFLDEIRPRYVMEKYHLTENNCNHFTEECSMFLVGTHIPEHIRNLPSTVLNSPFGAMIKPFIDNMFSPQNWGQNMGPVSPNFAQNFPPPISTPVAIPPQLATFTNLMTGLSSPSPSPFLPLSPSRAVLQSVPGHPHTKLTLPLLSKTEFILFKKAEIPPTFDKLNQFILEELKSTNNKALLLNDTQKRDLETLQRELINSSSKDYTLSFAIPSSVPPLFDLLLSVLPPFKRFPIIDILRLIILTPEGNKFYTQSTNPLLPSLLKTVAITKDQQLRAVKLLTLRLICNIFAWDEGINYITRKGGESILTLLVEVVVQGLHENEKILKRAISSICYNLSLIIEGGQNQEEALQLLSALIHVMGNEPSNESEVDNLRLMALGSLLYCWSEGVDIANSLEVHGVLGKYLSRKDTEGLAKEAQAIVS